MSDTHININLFADVGGGVDFVIDQLEKGLGIKQHLEPIVDEAVEIAQVLFSDTDVRVEKIETENGYQINASANDVAFQEFGAGSQTYEMHPLAQNVPFDVKPSSWSELHSQQFSKRGWWEHNGVRYEIEEWVTPHLGMMAANEHIVSRLS